MLFCKVFFCIFFYIMVCNLFGYIHIEQDYFKFNWLFRGFYQANQLMCYIFFCFYWQLYVSSKFEVLLLLFFYSFIYGKKSCILLSFSSGWTLFWTWYLLLVTHGQVILSELLIKSLYLQIVNWEEFLQWNLSHQIQLMMKV